jgi:disulfide bond formation protein DsbB
LILAGLASAFMLAAAHSFETFGGLRPCPLCLQQREPYWVALGIVAFGLAAAAVLKRDWIPRIAAGLLALVFGYSLYLGVFHAGVEWNWWPSPACGAAQDLDLSKMTGKDLLESLSKPRHVVLCNEAAWRMFGLSMAGYNAIISFGLMSFSALAALFPVSSGRTS